MVKSGFTAAGLVLAVGVSALVVASNARGPHDGRAAQVVRTILLAADASPAGTPTSPETAHQPAEASAPESTHKPAQESVAPIDRELRSDDLPDIRWRRELRVLLPASIPFEEVEQHPSYRPHVELLHKYTERHLLNIKWISVDSWDELMPQLHAGRGDLIVADVGVSAPRLERTAFTVPVRSVREKLVVRRGERIERVEDLQGREVAVRAQSAFWQLLKKWRTDHPEIGVRVIPEDEPARETLKRITTGVYDLAAADITAIDLEPDGWSDLRVLEQFHAETQFAWAVRPTSPELLESLNAFLSREQLRRRSNTLYKADLEGIKKRRFLRVLTRNNAINYFIWRGELLGFERELLGKFAKEQGLHLQMIVPESWEHMSPTLLEGGADMIASSYTITEERTRAGLAFTIPYNYAHEVLVSRANEPEISSLNELRDRTVWVRRSSSYWKTLERLDSEHEIGFSLRAAPEDMETEEIIAHVAKGEYDLTVADSNILDVELAWRDDVKSAMKLNGPVAHGWAVRQGDTQLLAALNDFIDRHYRKKFYNVIYKKYFESPRQVKRHRAARVDKPGSRTLSPYDDTVRKYAKRYDFDWALIIAQMYQESRFDPKARSWAGALGLMQVLPETGTLFGMSVENLLSVELGIKTGVRYMAWLRNQFDADLPVQDRMWFTLAAYNAGLGHVHDARRLAAEKGWDPNRWFGHVERAIRLLSTRKYYRRAKYGYVRGGQTVVYVREIRNLYHAYVSLTKTANLDLAP